MFFSNIFLHQKGADPLFPSVPDIFMAIRSCPLKGYKDGLRLPSSFPAVYTNMLNDLVWKWEKMLTGK